ncbi:MAG: Asp23/Gls24 family envelope stress response protein [Oscillospiraceae bacterium]|nr:Asp23/Gls24 family envelope stress response protein [Oscillospiraceae bacterium]
MADTKQYVTQLQENGNVLISEDVIAAIVANAIRDIEGVVGLSVKPGADIADMIGKKNWGKGMKITIGQDNALSIDCNINVGYGQNVVTIAKSVQNAVTAAVESTANVKVCVVNVNVCGIIRQ